MNLYFFNALPYDLQLVAVFETGAFLATRWQAENEAVNLYELPGRFFVEVTYDTATNELVGLLGFSDPAGLEDYAVYVQLPDWMGSRP